MPWIENVTNTSYYRVDPTNMQGYYSKSNNDSFSILEKNNLIKNQVNHVS